MVLTHPPPTPNRYQIFRMGRSPLKAANVMGDGKVKPQNETGFMARLENEKKRVVETYAITKSDKLLDGLVLLSLLKLA